MSLLKEGRNVFLGVPTGAGKPLPQLTTILTMPGQAIVIPPLQTIQMQMSLVCEQWGIPYLNLADTKNPDEITQKIEELNPKIILCSNEDISDEPTQRKLQKLDVAYVAVDESQVMDPVSGWCEIRPYCLETWKFIRASFKCPYLLLSATMEDLSLQRVLGKISA